MRISLNAAQPLHAELGHSLLEAHQAHWGGQGWEEILAASGEGREGWMGETGAVDVDVVCQLGRGGKAWLDHTSVLFVCVCVCARVRASVRILV